MSGVTFLIFQMAGVMSALTGSIRGSYQKKSGKRRAPMMSVMIGSGRSLGAQEEEAQCLRLQRAMSRRDVPAAALGSIGQTEDSEDHGSQEEEGADIVERGRIGQAFELGEEDDRSLVARLGVVAERVVVHLFEVLV